MAKLTAESLREVIRQLPEDRFTFDDVRRSIPADYESLMEVVFTLLTESKPTLSQVFDTKVRAMRFIRVNR